MAEEPGNQTPDTPDVSEDALREETVDELRREAKDGGVSGVSDMRKEELVRQVARLRSGRGTIGGGAEQDVGAGPEAGHLRTGDETSKSLKYSQEISSPEDEPEREGRSLATTHHEVIKRWAEERGGVPATVQGTEHGDHLGVLRFDFGGDSGDLRQVGWDEWFRTFDDRQLNFLYQERKSDGTQSNFFRLESPSREDA